LGRRKNLTAKFGTSGLRGLVVDLIDGAAQRYTTAFAAHLMAHGHADRGDEVFLGWDLRASSPALASLIAHSLAEAGLVAVPLGPLPTPALALHAMTAYCAAIMVTGSHIPDDRNGLKFYLPSGEITKTDEQNIEKLVVGTKAFLTPTTIAFHSELRANALASYIQRCKALLPEASLSGWHIGIYQHSSVARDILCAFIERAGAKVTPLGWSDTFVAVDTEDISPDVSRQLAAWTAEHQLDCIVSTDGDGDRPLMLDENGVVLRGDLLGILTAKLLQANVVVTPVTSSSGSEAVLDAEVLRTRVGSPFVIEAMQARGQNNGDCVVGFEANGGFLMLTQSRFCDADIAPLPTRDALLPLAAVLRLCVDKNARVSSLVAALQLPCNLSARLQNINSALSKAFVSELATSSSRRQQFLGGLGVCSSIDGLDGLKLHLSGRRSIHFRASGNAPELRIYVEAPDHADAERLLAQVQSRLFSTFSESLL
jgi:phosphomannomutase